MSFPRRFADVAWHSSEAVARSIPTMLGRGSRASRNGPLGRNTPTRPSRSLPVLGGWLAIRKRAPNGDLGNLALAADIGSYPGRRDASTPAAQNVSNRQMPGLI